MTERLDLTPRPPLSVRLVDPPALRVILSQPALLTSLQPVSQPVSIGPKVVPSLEVLQALMGPSGQVAVEGVETLPAGTAAEVENVGTPQQARLIFRLPRGDVGESGRQEVYIGAPAIELNYPAISFMPVEIDGQSVYMMQVNVP